MRSLIARAVVVVLMFATPAGAVSFQPDAPGVNGFTTVDKITWKDSKGLDREFYFAKSYPNAIAPGLKGYVTRLTWQPTSATRGSSPRRIPRASTPPRPRGGA